MNIFIRRIDYLRIFNKTILNYKNSRNIYSQNNYKNINQHKNYNQNSRIVYIPPNNKSITTSTQTSSLGAKGGLKTITTQINKYKDIVYYYWFIFTGVGTVIGGLHGVYSGTDDNVSVKDNIIYGVGDFIFGGICVGGFSVISAPFLPFVIPAIIIRYAVNNITSYSIIKK